MEEAAHVSRNSPSTRGRGIEGAADLVVVFFDEAVAQPLDCGRHPRKGIEHMTVVGSENPLPDVERRLCDSRHIRNPPAPSGRTRTTSPPKTFAGRHRHNAHNWSR